MFFNHQTRAIPVGKWDAMHEDDKGYLSVVNLLRI